MTDPIPKPTYQSNIDHTPVNPSSVRKMWQNLALRNKPTNKPPAIQTPAKNLSKPVYVEFAQQTSPLLPSYHPPQYYNQSQNQTEEKRISSSQNVNHNHYESEYRESYEPDINILDTIYSEPTYQAQGNYRCSHRSSVPKLKKANSEVYYQGEGERQSQETEVVSANRETADINILNSIKLPGKEEEEQLLKQWEQDILDQLETEKYLLQSSIRRVISYQQQQKQQQKNIDKQQSSPTTQVQKPQPKQLSKTTKKQPNKFLVFPPITPHNYEHQFQINRSLGYVFSEIINQTYRINPVGYQKWCEDLIMQDHIHHHMKNTRKSEQQLVKHHEIKRKSLPISVIFSFALILSIPVPEQIQNLQLHQFVTIAEILPTNQ